MLRLLKWSGATVATLLLGFVGFVYLRYDRTFEAPMPDLRASSDPDVIERGRYFVFGPAHCASCHGPKEQVEKVSVEGEPPLSGGFVYPLPFGSLQFPNLTPHEETGIGRYTDGELARVLRHGVKPNGRALLPVMEFQDISDEDIVAIISYLRAQKPVKRRVPPTELNFMGKVLATFVFSPMGPKAKPPAKSPPEEATVQRGEYLANRVAQCAQCHTKRDMTDLSYTGPRFAGGAELEEPFAPKLLFVTPNLTPDPETGSLRNWTEDDFVKRFRAGRVVPQSPMAWEFYARMSEADLRAIYRYLNSLEPVHNDTGASIRPRE